MIKYLKNPLLILFVTVSISWCVWTTTNLLAFSNTFNTTTEQFAQHKIDSDIKHNKLILSIKENFDTIKENFDKMGKKMDENFDKMDKMLMDIQKQIGE